MNRIFQNFNVFVIYQIDSYVREQKFAIIQDLLVTKEIFFVKYDPKNTKLGAFLDIISKPSRNILSHQVPNPLFFHFVSSYNLLFIKTVHNCALYIQNSYQKQPNIHLY